MVGVFTPSNPALPSFNVHAVTTPTLVRLETAFADFDRDEDRAVRFVSMEATDFYVSFGGPDVVVTPTNGMLILGGTAEVFGLTRNETHCSILGCEDTTVNLTIGYGA